MPWTKSVTLLDEVSESELVYSILVSKVYTKCSLVMGFGINRLAIDDSILITSCSI